MSVPVMGKTLPKMGKELPMNRRRSSMDYASAVAEALKVELGGSNRAIKTVMRWTGASERTAKGWLAGTNGPSGEHLVALLGNSDTLLERILKLAGRGSLIEAARLQVLRNTMAEAVASLDALLIESDAVRQAAQPLIDKDQAPVEE
jgi:hypothetical protein